MDNGCDWATKEVWNVVWLDTLNIEEEDAEEVDEDFIK